MITITCKIPEKLDVEIEALARHRRVTKSAIVREAIEERLRRISKKVTLRAFDLAKSLCGSLHGPRDLSTNPKYLERLGD